MRRYRLSLSEASPCRGSGAVSTASSPAFVDCVFLGNRDGLVCSGDAGPRLVGCTLRANTDCGLLVGGGARPFLGDCAIVENGSSGIYASSGSTEIVVERCTVARNRRYGLECYRRAAALTGESYGFSAVEPRGPHLPGGYTIAMLNGSEPAAMRS